MTMLRTFIAIELPSKQQEAVSQVVEKLQAKAGKKAVRWVAVENIHLTLKFLGDVAPNNLARIEDALKEEIPLHKVFQLEARGLGAFPNPEKPRVIWVGVKAPPELISLQHGIDISITRLGFASETRRFSPHLTLGRVCENASAQELLQISTAFKEVKFFSPGPFHVEFVHLFKSDLRPGGSIYTRLFSNSLTKS